MPGINRRPPGRTEDQVTRTVIDAALALGITLERRNTGGRTNAQGRYVAFGNPGDPDFEATLPDGRRLRLEIKRESFDPTRVRGKERARFEAQLDKLREVNRLGGVGLWVRDTRDFLSGMIRILEGWRIEIDAEGFCEVTNEPPKEAR